MRSVSTSHLTSLSAVLNSAVEIIYRAAAAKALKRIGVVQRERILAKMLDYAADPAAFANMVKRLVGDGRLRLRVGVYRVLVTEDGIDVDVHEVGHRGEIYRRLK